MNRKFYLDIENIHEEGLSNVNLLDSSDEVKVFYSVNFSKLSIGLVKQLLGISASLSFQFVRFGGANALDFYLTALVATDVEKYGNSKTYHILSRDNDFRHIESYVNETYSDKVIELTRVPSIKDVSILELQTNSIVTNDDEYLF